MKLNNFIEGLQILQQYFDNDGYYTSSEHDQFIVYPTDRKLSKEDVQKMKDLGWFQPDSDDYNPEENWSAIP